jgi:hypothetical protein
MKKLSSYQKLKAQNHALMQDIILMVDKPKSPEAIMCTAKYKFKIDNERMMWAGSPSFSTKK